MFALLSLLVVIIKSTTGFLQNSFTPSNIQMIQRYNVRIADIKMPEVNVAGYFNNLEMAEAILSMT